MKHSLRIRLLLSLGIAIAAVALLQFATSFHAAMGQANNLFDYHMQQMALALQDSSFEQNRWRKFASIDNEKFEFAVQVWTDSGLRVYQSRKFKVLPKQAGIGYSTVTLDNGDWRIYAVENNGRQIQVSQRMEARRDRAISLALHALWPVLAAAVLLFATAWWVVHSALSPLKQIGRELANRNVDSLTPISNERVPSEVSPLVAELNLLLTRVAQALESQQRFVADAAHELRTPLTALKLQVQTLARMKDDGGRTQAVTRLLGGVARASRLVEQLLSLARQDPLAQPRPFCVVSLTDCLEDAFSELRPFAASRQIELRLVETAQAEILGDADGLLILLRNLLDNAIRYCPEHGRIQASVRLFDDTAVVTIDDSGPGIPLQERERVFDRFYRVPGTAQSGSGLGLSIVKTIVDRHQAAIALGDAALGGLAITISFPAHRN